jgi:hypothetical protein
MFKNFKFFKSLIPKSTLVADSSGIVGAHAQSRVLHETIYYPTHPKRGAESAEFEQNKKEMILSGNACWICGGTAESTGKPLEGHHLNVEWSLINSVDLTKVQKYFSGVTNLQEFLDSKENLMILCARHHRSNLYGIHMITMPAWIAPRIQNDGWDLVNGPNAAAEPEDETKWFPEH